jgi:hypothetical protein
MIIYIKNKLLKYQIKQKQIGFQININIYASVEFGCVTIGEKNRVLVSNDVQIGYEMDVLIPIVNKTRHRLRYNIKMYNQQPMPETIHDCSSLSSVCSKYNEELEIEKIEYECTSEIQEDVATDTELEDAKSFMYNNSTTISIESIQSLNALKYKDAEKPSNQSQFVFKLDKDNGELGPNEKCYMKLSFCPIKSGLYTVNARCYLMCTNFPDIINILPLVIKGKGCNTKFEVRIKYDQS